MSGQVWLVTDQLPHPPRNGVTLPAFRYAQALAERQALRLVLIVEEGLPPDELALRANEALFGPISQLMVRRRSKPRRLLDEMRGIEMYQHGFAPSSALSEPLMISADDALLATPISAVAKLRALGIAVPRIAAALVNDCTAGEYFYRLQERSGNWRSRLKGSLDRWRSRRIGGIEARLLAPYAHVLLQTPRDREIFASLVGELAARRVELVPNGVDETLYALPERAPGRDVIFMAELSGEYGPIAHWLVGEVWPKVQRRGHRLRIVGRGASDELRQSMGSAPDLVYEDYVAELTDVYRDACVAISPVFKGFGMINKTLDAMAAGTAVLGGAAAFNGIAGFVPGVHGRVCQRPDAEEFVRALDEMLGDPPACERLGRAGRELIGRSHRWAASSSRVALLLGLPLQSPPT